MNDFNLPCNPDLEENHLRVLITKKNISFQGDFSKYATIEIWLEVDVPLQLSNTMLTNVMDVNGATQKRYVRQYSLSTESKTGDEMSVSALFDALFNIQKVLKEHKFEPVKLTEKESDAIILSKLAEQYT